MSKEIDPKVQGAIDHIMEMLSRTPREVLAEHAPEWKVEVGGKRLDPTLIRSLRFQIMASNTAIMEAMRREDYEVAKEFCQHFLDMLKSYHRAQGTEDTPVEVEGVRQTAAATIMELSFIIRLLSDQTQ
jgi:hypothetical protein